MADAGSELRKMLREPYVDSEHLNILIEKYQNEEPGPDKDFLREQIFNNNIRFIRKQVMQKVISNPEFIEDAFNSAVISFYEGLDKFDLSKGFSFQTYISFWIKRGIYQEFISRNIVSIPINDFFDPKIKEAKLARNSSMLFIDKPVIKMGEKLEHDYIKQSLSQKILKETRYQEELGDSIDEIYIIIKDILVGPEVAFIYWKYLYDPCLTLEEIGSIAHMKKERVRQILAKALFKIKKRINKEEFSKSWERDCHSSRLSFNPKQIEEIYEEKIKSRHSKNYKKL